MHQQELRDQSKTILNSLGESLAKAFSLDGNVDDDAIEALMERLDEIGVSRDFALESAVERTSRLLANTANQAIQ